MAGERWENQASSSSPDKVGSSGRDLEAFDNTDIIFSRNVPIFYYYTEYFPSAEDRNKMNKAASALSPSGEANQGKSLLLAALTVF